MKHYSHGEMNIFKSTDIPDGVKKVRPKKGKYIVADSETTGNHHCVKDAEGVEMYEKDGVLYLRNNVPAEVFCVHEGRHDTITLDPGVWELEAAQEYDYLTKEKRAVAD